MSFISLERSCANRVRTYLISGRRDSSTGPRSLNIGRRASAGLGVGFVALVSLLGTQLPAADNTRDLRPLVEALARKRCAEDREYRTIAGVPCSKSGGSGATEEPDQVLQKIGASTRQEIQTLSMRARNEDGACARGVVTTAAGGTSIGPTTSEQLAQTIIKAAVDDAMNLTLPVGTMLSIPGVTQVQYNYKGLPNGPEVRTFRISGRLEGDVEDTKLRLRMDGDVEGDKNLYVEYMVNYRKDRRPFPAWSPFLEKPGDIRRNPVRQGLTTLSAAASFSEKGQQRNGVKVWHDYEYFWHADRVGVSPKDIVKQQGAQSEQFADYPYGGDWVGVGWGSEMRFKQTRKGFVAQFSPAAANTMKTEEGTEGVIMSLNVKHQTVFYFHVDYDGNVSGRGTITYTLDPNLCGVAVLTRQVNEQINFMKHLPAVYTAARQLGELAVRRFQSSWAPAPPTITTKLDEVLRNLPRIQPAAGEAEIARFVAANPRLPNPRNCHYAFADIEVENFATRRLFGPASGRDYPGIRDVARRTPRNAAGEYAGRFRTRPGRPGWFEDGKWFEQDPGTLGAPGKGPGWNRREMNIRNLRGNDSELRILEQLAGDLPPRARGTIRLYTQNPPCSSCAGVLEQFSAMFPDILIVITSRG